MNIRSARGSGLKTVEPSTMSNIQKDPRQMQSSADMHGCYGLTSKRLLPHEVATQTREKKTVSALAWADWRRCIPFLCVLLESCLKPMVRAPSQRV